MSATSSSNSRPCMSGNSSESGWNFTEHVPGCGPPAASQRSALPVDGDELGSPRDPRDRVCSVRPGVRGSCGDLRLSARKAFETRRRSTPYIAASADRLYRQRISVITMVVTRRHSAAIRAGHRAIESRQETLLLSFRDCVVSLRRDLESLEYERRCAAIAHLRALDSDELIAASRALAQEVRHPCAVPLVPFAPCTVAAIPAQPWAAVVTHAARLLRRARKSCRR